MTALLSASDVGKQYRTGRERPLADLLRPSTTRLRWALRHVSVEVAAGEVVAVIGRNGAGKSTFLKIAAGVTQPSEGTIDRPERIAPLIEVGAGFHPELTGRENVQVNGQLLGLTKREAKASFDDIVAFAELEHAIDQPVRQYSTGMFMRLGFSVAIHTRPQFLIVDEVLAVGDLPFQVRCLDRIKEMRGEGVGVLFVSHNLTAVLNIADRCVLLEKGEMRTIGEVSDVVGAYHDLLATATEEGEGQIGDDVPPSGELELGAARLTEPDGTPVSLWRPGQQARLRIDVSATRAAPEGLVGLRVIKEGVGIVASWRADDGPFVPALAAGGKATIDIDLELNLAEGRYLVDVAVARRDWTSLMAHRDRLVQFAVAPRPGCAGVADLAPRLEVST